MTADMERLLVEIAEYCVHKQNVLSDDMKTSHEILYDIVKIVALKYHEPEEKSRAPNKKGRKSP